MTTSDESLLFQEGTSIFDVAAFLLKHGVSMYGKPIPITSSKDGAIYLNKTLHIQVGSDYAFLRDDCFIGLMRHKGEDILSDILAYNST